MFTFFIYMLLWADIKRKPISSVHLQCIILIYLYHLSTESQVTYLYGMIMCILLPVIFLNATCSFHTGRPEWRQSAITINYCGPIPMDPYYASGIHIYHAGYMTYADAVCSGRCEDGLGIRGTHSRGWNGWSGSNKKKPPYGIEGPFIRMWHH